MKIITHEKCVEYGRRGHPERPLRIEKSWEKLRGQTELPLDWATPVEVSEEALLRAHAHEHLADLRNPWNDFDADTPAHPEIYEHALRSVGGALHAFQAARSGEYSFSLLRPPGHHATRDRAMGFCYLNSIAISALHAVASGVPRVAVFDFDVHHGNGTEAILMGQPGCAFFSVHQYPAYPGTGAESTANCFNYPVAPGVDRQVYREALTRAMDELKRFKPAMVAVSAGFDAYRGDPLSNEPLEPEDYHWLGATIRSLDIPAFSVLEGGYSHQLPELIFSYLKGLAGQ